MDLHVVAALHGAVSSRSVHVSYRHAVAERDTHERQHIAETQQRVEVHRCNVHPVDGAGEMKRLYLESALLEERRDGQNEGVHITTEIQHVDASPGKLDICNKQNKDGDGLKSV